MWSLLRSSATQPTSTVLCSVPHWRISNVCAKASEYLLCFHCFHRSKIIQIYIFTENTNGNPKNAQTHKKQTRRHSTTLKQSHLDNLPIPRCKKDVSVVGTTIAFLHPIYTLIHYIFVYLTLWDTNCVGVVSERSNLGLHRTLINGTSSLFSM